METEYKEPVGLLLQLLWVGEARSPGLNDDTEFLRGGSVRVSPYLDVNYKASEWAEWRVDGQVEVELLQQKQLQNNNHVLDM